MNETMPVFVKIDEYNKVIDILNEIKSEIEKAKKVIADVNKLRLEEDTELDLWQANVEDVERKIDFINHVMFKPNQF